MIDNNKIMESQLLLGKGYLNLIYLTSYDVVAAVLNVGAVCAMT